MRKWIDPKYKKGQQAQVCAYQMMNNKCNGKCGRYCGFDRDTFRINHNTQYQNCVFVPGQDNIWLKELCPYLHARKDNECPWGERCHNKDTHNMTERQADEAIRNGTHYLLYSYHGNFKGKTFPTKPPKNPPALSAPVAEAGWSNSNKRHTTRRHAEQLVADPKNFPPLKSVRASVIRKASSEIEYASKPLYTSPLNA